MCSFAENYLFFALTSGSVIFSLKCCCLAVNHLLVNLNLHFSSRLKADAERQKEERRAEELFRWEERPARGRRAKR